MSIRVGMGRTKCLTGRITPVLTSGRGKPKLIIYSCIFSPGVGQKQYSLNSQEVAQDSLKNRLSNVFYRKFQQYEDIIGLTEVKEAQNKVITAEKKFMETQERRRECQKQLHQLQAKLKEVHVELDKTMRGEDRYLHLITQEHSIIREERSLMEEFSFLESSEREYFSALSLAVRESHEKERAQAERTKYWSIIGSICGAVIGILGTTINNRIRMKELRELVMKSSSNTNLQPLVETVAGQQQQIGKFVTDLKELLGQSNQSIDEPPKLELLTKNTTELLHKLQEHDRKLGQEMKQVKSLVATQLALHRVDETDVSQPVSVFIGEDLKEIVKKSESNLEWKMKVNSLATVAFVYGAFAVTVPIIMQIFRGGK